MNVYWKESKTIGQPTFYRWDSPQSVFAVAPHNNYEPHPFIVKTPDTCNGEPRIAGTRLSVRIIADLFWQGESVENIADMYGIEQWEAYKAIDYAIMYKAEIEDLILRNERA